MMACIGTIAWHRFSFNSICKIIQEVVVSKGIIGANTESKWRDTASRAFERLVDGTGGVAGADSLKRQLIRSSNNKMNLKQAEQEVENFVSILKAGSCYDPHPFKTKNKKELFLKQSKKMKAFIELEELFLALRANYRN